MLSRFENYANRPNIRIRSIHVWNKLGLLCTIALDIVTSFVLILDSFSKLVSRS